MEFKQIRAVYDKNTIRVYQAYCPAIASEAVKLGKFGGNFSLNRMTWIKPSFLWMMYRCGWAQKPGQERVIAIDIDRNAFDYMINNAVVSSYKPELGITREEWKELIQTSEVRMQWDPERDIYGNPLEYRSIQIGIRGLSVYRYVNEWTRKITDITDFVKELDSMKNDGIDITAKLPKEEIYIPSKPENY